MYLERQRTEQAFEKFYIRAVQDSRDLTAEPTLPRYRKRPRRIEDGESNHRFDTTEAYFHQQYYEALDLLKNELINRFQQPRGLPVAASIEKVLLDATHGVVSDELPDELQVYAKDIDLSHLKIQLQMFPDLLKAYNTAHQPTAIHNVTNLNTLCQVMNDVNSSKVMFKEVFTLHKIFLTIPVTTANAERTFSALRRLKTYLRSTMSQPRLNHVMLLHIHKERTDSLDLVQVARDFISVNNRRALHFGHF